MKIRVKTNANEQSVENKGDYYLAKLKSLPQDGKANLELLKVLKKHFGKNFKIVRGLKNRNKIVCETE